MRNFCISHSKDVDGIGSAALVVAARGGRFKLTSYDDVFGDLDNVPKDIDELVLCDIGTDPAKAGEFVSKLGGLAKRCRVTYIDHHYIDESSKKKIRKHGIRLVHNTKECASMLTYKTLIKELPEEAGKIALYGAVTDYMDNSPRAKQLMERSDRHYILLEATLLSHALARKGDDVEFVNSVVGELAKMRQPHEIDDVVGLAIEQLNEVALLTMEVKRLGMKLKRVAYANTTQQATGNVAKLLNGAFNTPVGVSFREKSQKGWYEVSLRGTSECRVHLGRAVGKLVQKYGGAGGGHRLAAGCRIPKDRMESFLLQLDKIV
jgi:RecJ-like exonuclease